jgi:hypothetical protein
LLLFVKSILEIHVCVFIRFDLLLYSNSSLISVYYLCYFKVFDSFRLFFICCQ